MFSRSAVQNIVIALVLTAAPLTAAIAGCREDAIEAAKACLTEDLEAGMGEDSGEAQRILGELAATGQDIKNLNRQGDLYKKLAAQSKRSSLLAAMKSRACSKAYKACSSSCAVEQNEPQAQEAASACQRIGAKNAKLAEAQAEHSLKNMQTNESGLASTATMIDYPEGKTGNSACNDSYSSPECSRQSMAAQSSGSGARTHSAEQYYTATAIDPVTGEESGGTFHFDGRFETSNDSSTPSLFSGDGGMASAANETGAASEGRFETSSSGSAPATSPSALVASRKVANIDRETADDGDDEIKDGTKKSLKKRALKVIQGFMNFVSGGRISLPLFDDNNPSTGARLVKLTRKAKAKQPVKVAGEPPAILKKDGVTSATGMSLFEKIHRQYQIQEASLAQD